MSRCSQTTMPPHRSPRQLAVPPAPKRARPVRLLVLALAALVFTTTSQSCVGPLADAASLRRLRPLDYSVWMTGGAFVPLVASSTLDDAPYARTFTGRSALPDDLAPEDPTVPIEVVEAIPLTQLEQFLGTAAVFVQLAVDGRAFGERAATRGDVDLDERLLQQVRAAGHDLMLVVRALEDGAIEDQGINDRWPVTLLTWLGLGLGMVIPDHTFESRATLTVSLVDPWSGEELWREAFDAGPVELALVDRGSLLGLVVSIIVPPFWVYSDRARVGRRVRSDSARRLAVSVARRLKRSQVADAIAAARAVEFELEVLAVGVRVRCEADEALSFVRVRQDGEGVDAATFAPFEARLLASQRAVEPAPGLATSRRYRYEAVWTADEGFAAPERLQVLAQTVAGRVGSTTVVIDPGSSR